MHVGVPQGSAHSFHGRCRSFSMVIMSHTSCEHAHHYESSRMVITGVRGLLHSVHISGRQPQPQPQLANREILNLYFDNIVRQFAAIIYGQVEIRKDFPSRGSIKVAPVSRGVENQVLFRWDLNFFINKPCVIFNQHSNFDVFSMVSADSEL